MKLFILSLLITVFILTLAGPAAAQVDPRCSAKRGNFNGQPCSGSDLPDYTCTPQAGVYMVTRCIDGCITAYSEANPDKLPANCRRPASLGTPGALNSVEKVFGLILPPPQIIQFGFGSSGISAFLNMVIGLIFMAASIIFVFIIIWGAIELLLSGGNKEAVASARGRLTFAIIGIILMAVAFAVLKLIGTFTGFTFFG